MPPLQVSYNNEEEKKVDNKDVANGPNGAQSCYFPQVKCSVRNATY